MTAPAYAAWLQRMMELSGEEYDVARERLTYWDEPPANDGPEAIVSFDPVLSREEWAARMVEREQQRRNEG